MRSEPEALTAGESPLSSLKVKKFNPTSPTINTKSRTKIACSLLRILMPVSPLPCGAKLRHAASL